MSVIHLPELRIDAYVQALGGHALSVLELGGGGRLRRGRGGHLAAVGLLDELVIDGLVPAELGGQVRRYPVGGQDEVEGDVRQPLGLGLGLRRRVDLCERRLILGGRHGDALLAGEFVVDLEPDQPGERPCVSCAELIWMVPGYRLTAWLRLVTSVVEGRDRDSLVAQDRRVGARGTG